MAAAPRDHYLPPLFSIFFWPTHYSREALAFSFNTKTPGFLDVRIFLGKLPSKCKLGRIDPVSANLIGHHVSEEGCRCWVSLLALRFQPMKCQLMPTIADLLSAGVAGEFLWYPSVVLCHWRILGLTTALLLSRDSRYSISVIAKHMPGDYDIEYASPWAGANYMP